MNEIKKVEATKVEPQKKLKLYCVVWWEKGAVQCNHPSPIKEFQEQYLTKISALEESYNCEIYEFEVDRPIIK